MESKNFVQLNGQIEITKLSNKNDLTENQLRFLDTHNNILNAGTQITNNLIVLSKNLKQMRDDKLYLEANIDSFEDYAEKICGLKRAQAYAYIQVLERLGEDFVQLTGQIGITKLLELSKLDEEDKELIVNKVDLQDTTVADLKKEIAVLKQEKVQILDKQKSFADENKKNADKISRLNKQIETLKNSNKEIQVVENEETVRALEDAKIELDSLKEQYSKRESLILSLEKKLSINQSVELVEFKLLFEELQQTITKINQVLKKLPEDKILGCKNALKKVGETLC